MARLIRSVTPNGNGYTIEVEVENAYTDGTSRFDLYHVSADALRTSHTPEQRLQAILDVVDDRATGDLIGLSLTAPTQTKALLETKMAAQYENWQRWKNTRAEAQVPARGVPPAVVTALTNRENAAWGEYLNAIQAWRAAP